MTINRILSWGVFIVIIGLIVWGMVAAANKAEKIDKALAPVDKVVDTDWVRGSTTTEVTIIEYSDFQCPACGAYFPIVEEVNEKYGNNFRFVYRHFPLTQHKNAIPAAQAAEAAGVQGKFWDMYKLIFTNQKDWVDLADPMPRFTEYATTLGLDIAKFTTDYDLKSIKDGIDADQKSGVKAGVDSTPTFYLNGKKINAQSYEQFKKLIDEAATTTVAS